MKFLKMSIPPNIMNMMSLSINTAKRAGTIIRDIMSKGDLGIVDKGIDDPQTEADRCAQRCIIGSISKMFPNVKIIGEEDNLEETGSSGSFLVTELDKEFLKDNECPSNLLNIRNEDFVVWVDPLDGTSEYTQGFLDHVTVLIGIAVNDSPVGGIIHQPYYRQENGDFGRTVWGLKGLGVGGFKANDPPEGKFIVTTTRSHSNNVVQSALEALNPSEILRVGGAGYKVLQLIEGQAHAYVFASKGCKKWDTCAPEAILETLGGTLTDIYGNHYKYNSTVEFPNKNGVIATAKGVQHEEIIKKIPDSIKENL